MPPLERQSRCHSQQLRAAPQAAHLVRQHRGHQLARQLTSSLQKAAESCTWQPSSPRQPREGSQQQHSAAYPFAASYSCTRQPIPSLQAAADGCTQQPIQTSAAHTHWQLTRRQPRAATHRQAAQTTVSERLQIRSSIFGST